jgi:hypothetical protein
MNNIKENIYKALPVEDSCLALQANLEFLLNSAYKIIFQKKGGISRYQTSNDFIHTSEEIYKLDHITNFMLEIIGKYSNERFGDTAELQDRFFQRKYEQPGFFTHLFISIQSHKAKQIGNVKGQTSNEIITYPFFNNYHLEFSLDEDKKTKYFVKDKISYTEKQLYASGVYYVIPFILRAIKEGDSVHLSKLLISASKYIDGINYSGFQSMRGGNISGNKRSQNKEKAYSIFVKKNIYKNSQRDKITRPKNYILAENLHGNLPKNIKVSLSTITTDWIPEFVKRYNKEKLG